MISVTEQWTQFAVAGPRSRELLQGILDRDISNAAFPYMACGPVRVGGVDGRLFRVSFSGELAFEVAVPTRYGACLWEALIARGAVPYGTEALSVMRIEKGHAAGAELNGKTTAHDLGMARLLSTKKDFIGRTLASREALTDPARPRLVGLRPVDRTARLRAGALLLPRGVAPAPAHDQGHVTSVAHSPQLGHWIALGLLARGPDRIGERVRAWDPVRNGDLEVEVCPPVFIDPEGAKLRA
jgi:sarcosine oxidase subunit alpha